MALLNKVIENKRDSYMIQVLEESTSELESLKTKQYLNENLSLIGKILMEEGVVDAAKANLANNWGKYAVGAGVLGAGVAAGEAIAHPGETAALVNSAAEKLNVDPDTNASITGNTYNVLQGAQDKITNGYEAVKGYLDPAEKFEKIPAEGPVTNPVELQNTNPLREMETANNAAVNQAMSNTPLTQMGPRA